MSPPKSGAPSPIFVTGASGFVAGALVDCYRHAGVECVGVARRDGPMVDLCLSSYAEIHPADAGARLVHLAQPNALPSYAQRAQETARQAIDLVSVLAQRFGQKMVYASSAVVYGDRHQTSVLESAPRDGHGPYAQMKIRCEDIVLSAGGTVARLGNTIGPGMNGSTVPAEVAHQIIHGPSDAPIRVRKCDVARDWIAVADVAEALAVLSGGGVTGAVNVGSGAATTVAQIASMMCEIAGQGHRAVVQTAPQAPDAPRSCIALDATRLKTITQWRPKVGLEDCLTEYLKAEGFPSACVK